MNLLRLFFITFWGKSNNHYSFQQFHNVLARKEMNKKVKDFYAYDDFFRTIVQAHIIALCMHHKGFTKIDDLQTLLCKNNWPDVIAQVEKQYLGLDKVQDIRK